VLPLERTPPRGRVAFLPRFRGLRHD
jgi:hypothetical protein